MIIYSKPKNSLKHYFPYLNLALVIIMIGTFVAFNLPTRSEEAAIVQETQAQIVQTVDVSGEWVGTMTEDYGAEIRYEYRIVLTQDGTSIRGTDFQQSTNYGTTITSEAALIGSMTGTSLYFYEANVTTLEGVTLDSWCRIEVRLEYEEVNGLETLVGTWDSAEEERAGCITVTGRVVLTRQPE